MAYLDTVTMSVLDYYISLENIGKKYNIPCDVLRHILEYEKLNIMENKNMNFLKRKIILNKMFIENKRDLSIAFHTSEIPYEIYDVYKFKEIIIKLIKKNKMNLHFSHYCCKEKDTPPKGVVFARPPLYTDNFSTTI